MTATPFQSALTERAAEENIKAMLASAAKAAAAKVEAETATAAVPSVSGAVSSPAVPSVATTSTQPQHHPVEYSFAWSVATQKGYRYANTFSRAASTKLDIHEHMEDMHYPAQEQTPNNVHPLTGQTYQLFMLADGHGGHACARFAIER